MALLILIFMHVCQGFPNIYIQSAEYLATLGAIWFCITFYLLDTDLFLLYVRIYTIQQLVMVRTHKCTCAQNFGKPNIFAKKASICLIFTVTNSMVVRACSYEFLYSTIYTSFQSDPDEQILGLLTFSHFSLEKPFSVATCNIR